MCTSTLQVPSTQKKMHEKFNFSPRSSSFFLQSHGHAQLGQNFTEVAFATYLPMFARKSAECLNLGISFITISRFNHENLENETIK